MGQRKSKYKNIKVYFDPTTTTAYWDGDFVTREFRLVKSLTSATVLKRCYRFDSMHEYYCYRIVQAKLPSEYAILRQVNFLVIPKTDLGSEVTYRADLVVVRSFLGEDTVRYWAMQREYLPFDFLVIEPKGVLTDSARIKHLALCDKGKITAQQILFVASNVANLNLPSEVKSSLFHLPVRLEEKIELIFGDFE
ncbi:hypothetical protein [Microcoleus sp. D2_18a_B4]|uniref:hypothetical protein n=1 Tax=Microcoleus sp. D2_18a_B4 TaxID=3055329 RepID=UPI002FD73D98